MSEAKIIGWNTYGEEIAASAARISTTSGSALELFEKAQERDDNGRLIAKVVSSGHRSVLEHMFVSIAFQNVSVYVEQFMIECRLASFTVKSRRYVDFTNQGFYTPPDLVGDALVFYRRYMQRAFQAYEKLLALDIPKEDARFLLPYSFCSNFYCTLNARELVRVVRDMQTGRGARVPELQMLAQQLQLQIEVKMPYLVPELNKPYCCNVEPFLMPLVQDGPEYVSGAALGKSEFRFGPRFEEVAEILRMAHRAAMGDDMYGGMDLCKLLNSDRPRELEMLNYGFSVQDLTLAGLTHLTRHRMQSLIVPPLENINYTRFVMPESIQSNSDASYIYVGALEAAVGDIRTVARDCVLKRYMPYFALSGNLIGTMTCMNARELLLFIKLRSCNRAQWEIRQVAVNMLRELRQLYPTLFMLYGPSCYVTGVCPEGRMSCGKVNEVR